MNTQEIVAKLWNLCNVLRDDGITYHQYVTELTYILFLKMAKETGVEANIPEAYRWDNLVNKSGIELKNFYKELLDKLGTNTTGRIREIYQGSATNIEEPKNLEKIIKTIDELDWYSAKEEGLGNLYEGLLEKNANEKRYFIKEWEEVLNNKNAKIIPVVLNGFNIKKDKSIFPPERFDRTIVDWAKDGESGIEKALRDKINDIYCS